MLQAALERARRQVARAKPALLEVQARAPGCFAGNILLYTISCVCVCAHVFVCTFLGVSVFVCVRARVHVCERACVHAFVCVGACMCVCARACVCASVHVCARACAC